MMTLVQCLVSQMSDKRSQLYLDSQTMTTDVI